MLPVNAVIDNCIRLNPRDLPKKVLDEIFDKLRVVNPQKKVAEREMLWNAKNVPSHIELWKYNGYNELILPRGFLGELWDMIKYNNLSIKWHNNTIFNIKNYFDNVSFVRLRNYQQKAIINLLSNDSCGVYKAPTGSGKTRVMLALVKLINQRTLIICEKSDIAQQWVVTAKNFGFSIGLIGNGKWEDKDLTISLRQSFTNIDDPINISWFDQWGMVILDECHHASAETMFELLQKFRAYYRYGCSATPDSDPDLFSIARAVIGPVVAETTIEEIGDHLVTPSVKVVKTEFEFLYRPTRSVTNEIAKLGTRVIRNNYNDMMSALEKDLYRNRMIMNLVIQEAEKGKTCLVFSNRKNHLKYLYNSFDLDKYDFDTEFLTGENSSSEYNLIRSEIEIEGTGNGFVLFSTLANEGTDIVRLDRIFLVYPGRKLRGFEQSIGRIMRPHPKKKDAIVYDFRDYKVPLLNSQYRNRVQGIYNKRGYKVETING